MNCPYCSKEMVSGRILGDRYQLKWMPNNKKEFLGIWATNSIKLGTMGFLKRPSVDTYFCADCNKMIIEPDKQ